MKNLFLIGILASLACSAALAGGSVEWEFHALPLLKKHPELLAIIEKSLDVARNGGGVRLGKDFGEEQGKRIPPFEFPARVQGSTGPYNLVLIIHDPSGLTSQGDEQTWIEIRPKK